MRFLAYGMIPLGALLAGVLGTVGLLLLTPHIRAIRQLPLPAQIVSWVEKNFHSGTLASKGT
jgi:hypothetical protein